MKGRTYVLPVHPDVVRAAGELLRSMVIGTSREIALLEPMSTSDAMRPLLEGRGEIQPVSVPMIRLRIWRVKSAGFDQFQYDSMDDHNAAEAWIQKREEKSRG